jgi:hypothetical protein
MFLQLFYPNFLFFGMKQTKHLILSSNNLLLNKILFFGVTNSLKQGNTKVGLYMGWDMVGSGQNIVVCRYRGGSGQR